MRIIRKAKLGEIDKILKIINSSFEPVRFKGYDISESVTRIYKSNFDYSESHCIIEDDGKIIATAGNIINQVLVNNKTYPFSIIGSVSTIPNMQNKGCMKDMINFFDKENINQNIVFSMLTGLRHRYKHFGYEKTGFKFSFEINKQFSKFQSSYSKLSIEETKQNDLDVLYNIYLKNSPFILRKKDEFLVTLNMSYSIAYTVKLNNEIIGYFTYSKRKNKVNELILIDYSLVPFVIKYIIDTNSLEDLTVFSSPFNKQLFKELDKISEYKCIYDELHFKVYDLKKFLEMTINMNLKIKNIQNLTKILKIDNEILEISIQNNNVNISQANSQFEKQFSKDEFLRYAFSINSLYDNDNLFPLYLDFENCDLF